MCNDYANRVAYRELADAFSPLKLPIVWPTADRAPNLEPRDDIRPTEAAPVIRAVPGGVELVSMKWGLEGRGPKAPPVINFRSEGRAFESGRCLAPATAFYEFTGTRYPKTKWRFSLSGEPWFCMAGFWRPGGEGVAGRFTLLTTQPGPDIAPYHDRQVVVLRPADWAAWLGGADAAALLRPLPAGSLAVGRMPSLNAEPDLFGAG